MSNVTKKATPPTTPLPERAPLGSCHRGGTFEYRATPDKNIIRPNVYHSNNTKRSATAFCRHLRHAEEIGWTQVTPEDALHMKLLFKEQNDVSRHADH